MSFKQRLGIDISAKAKTVFCGYNPVGDFAALCCKGAEITIDEPTETVCWCCAFWRGVLVGGVVGVLTGALICVL